MSSHPPVPTLAGPPLGGPAGDHPLMEKQEESSLPMLGDSQFELVLDDSMRVNLVDDDELEPPALPVIEAQAPIPEPRSVEDDGDELDDELRRYHARRSWLLVGCNVLVVGAAGYFGYSTVMPMQANLAALEDKRTVLEHELGQSKTALASAEAQRTDAEQRQGELKAALALKESEWAAKQAVLDAAAEKVAWIPTTKAALEAALAPEIKRGEVAIFEDGAHVVVELADRALFSGQEPVLGDKGKVLLGKVGPLLLGIEGKALRIAGHVDAAPTAALVDRYPTGWELSAARSAQVVRYLRDTTLVPGERLILESYGEFRPRVPGKTVQAKKRNRRVEVAIGP